MPMQPTSHKQVIILINLSPRKIMGVESQGLILMAEDHDGKPRLIQPDEQWLRNKLSDNGYLN
jgi:tRNA-binding EMAP/Myf-like protein